jgi:hypothetical protein
MCTELYFTKDALKRFFDTGYESFREEKSTVKAKKKGIIFVPVRQFKKGKMRSIEEDTSSECFGLRYS